MADNIGYTPGSGATVAADDIGGVLHQRVKVTLGANNSNDGDVSSANPMPVSGSVEVTTLPALAAGTANIGDVDIASIAAGDNNIGNVDVVSLPALAAGTNNIGDVDVLTLPNVTIGTMAALVAGNANIGDVDVASLPTAMVSTDRLKTITYDPDLALSPGITALADRLVAERYTVGADSLADGVGTYWTQTTANGGTVTSSGGEGLIQTSANATGSAQAVSPTMDYHPGQVNWFNSAIRVDTGSAGNVRRWGAFTVSGTTPQEGFYYELSATTLNAVVVKAGTPSATAVASWSNNAAAPFTLDANFHQWEIRYTANTVWFYVDRVLRHAVSGTTSPITTTLNFPIALQSINSSGATNRVLGARNVGMGRFGRRPAHSVQTTTASVAGSASNVTLLAASWSRKGATVHNDSTAILYLKCGASSSTTDFTVKMQADQYYEVPFGYLGIITGTWASATGNARTTEFV